jgi:hypothetical protein
MNYAKVETKRYLAIDLEVEAHIVDREAKEMKRGASERSM